MARGQLYNFRYRRGRYRKQKGRTFATQAL